MKKITTILLIFSFFTATSQVIMSGGIIQNRGAKGDMPSFIINGNAVTDGSSITISNDITNPNAVIVNSVSDFFGTDKDFYISADFTLTANLTLPDGARLIDNGGVMTVGSYDINGTNLSFYSEYNRTFIDLGANGTINDSATFTNGDINLAWFGIVFDGVEGVYGGATQSGTDNRNVIIQAQKIYNSLGSGNPVIKGNGTFAMSALAPPALARDEPTGMYITGNVHMTWDSGVTMLILPNNLQSYDAFVGWKTQDASFIGGRIIGDRIDHDYSGGVSENCYGVVAAAACDGFTFKPDLISQFSGDGAISKSSWEVIYSTSGSNGIEETDFEVANGGAKDYIIDNTGTPVANTDFAYSKLFSLSNTKFADAGQMLLGGNVAYGGQSGYKGNNLFVAFYDDLGNFIERTDLVETYSNIPLKSTYKQFRLIIPTPDVWADLVGTIYAPQSPKRVVYSPKKVTYCVRQGTSNISSYSRLTGIDYNYIGRRADGTIGSPAFIIDIEDGFQLLNNIEIDHNYFGNSARGFIILKGTKYVNIHDNIFPYRTVPNWSSQDGIFLENGHETMFHQNTVYGTSIYLGRRDDMTDNRLKDVTIYPRLEDEVVHDEHNAYNIRFITNSTDTGTGISYFKNNTWRYDKPLDGTKYVFTHRQAANIVRENEIFDFQGQTVDATHLLSSVVTGESGISKGYVNNVVIKNLKASSGREYDTGLQWVYQPLKNFTTSISLDIRGADAQDVVWDNVNIEGWLNLQLNDFPATNTGTFKTLTIKNPNINIINSADLNSGRFAFTSAAKDINLVVEGGSINIKIGTHSNADDFLSLANYGTKIFKGVTFYTDQASSTQALDSSYEFIDCTFTNITFTGATITTTTGGADGLGWTGGSYDSGTGIVTFTSDDGLGFSTTDLRGAAGATVGSVKRGYLHFNKYDDRFVIDLAAETFTLTSYTTSILRSDDLKLQTPVTSQKLDFSGFLTLNEIVYLYWDKATQLFYLGGSVSTFANDSNKYFITSFRRYTSQDDLNLSFNRHAFKVVGTSDKYIQKWAILGDSHTFSGSTWINIVDRDLEIKSILNLGISGSDIAGTTGSNSFWDRKSGITSDVDLLTIFGGTNDFEHTKTIGSLAAIGGTFDETTVIGALQGIIEYAYTVNQAMKITIITPHYHFDANTGGTQYDLDSYVNAIKSVAALYHIPVLDLNEVLGINALNYPSFMNTGQTKPIHLNTLGMEKAGHAIEQFLKANY